MEGKLFPFIAAVDIAAAESGGREVGQQLFAIVFVSNAFVPSPSGCAAAACVKVGFCHCHVLFLPRLRKGGRRSAKTIIN